MDQMPLIYRRGHDYFFDLAVDQKSWRFTVPSDLLDDEIGNSRSDNTSRNWIADHWQDLSRAAQLKVRGGYSLAPYNRIVIEEA